MHFLQVRCTESTLTLSGPNCIIRKLNLPKADSYKWSYNGFAKVIIHAAMSPAPLDVVFLSIYSRASSLSGTIVEEFSSQDRAFRYILWSFPENYFLSRIRKEMGLFFLVKCVALAFVLRYLSSCVLNSGIHLFLCVAFLLYIHRIFT